MHGVRFALLRRSQTCICSTRMSLTDDSKESIERLRNMQHSILSRRKKKARELSTSHEKMDPASQVPQTEAVPRHETKENDSPASSALSESTENVPDLPYPLRPSHLSTLKQRKARTSVSNRRANNRMNRSVDDKLANGVSKLKLDSMKPITALKVEAKKRESTPNHSMFVETLSEPTNFGDQPSDIDQHRIHGRCKLEKQDGTLPLAVSPERKSLATIATADPVFVLMPSLEEFEIPVPFDKGEWHLPRINSFDYVSRTSKVQPPSKVIENLSNDCEEILKSLNPQQAQAVTAEVGTPCLVLAGPGSGKTRVLTHRAAYLCRRYNLPPHRILAVTFTNKAAEEMKTRLRSLLNKDDEHEDYNEGDNSNFKSDFVVGTFHSICARILRAHGEAVGINSDFQICDTSDCKQVVATLIRKRDNIAVGEKSQSVPSEASMILRQISRLKNHEEDEMKKAYAPHVFKKIDSFRHEYDKALRKMNQLDFDDLLLETKRLLQKSEISRRELQNRYKHILVDEWQDTNIVQFEIVSLLAANHQNLFVVGDDDQAIFKFRGADVRNLTRFMENFPAYQEIRLEKNYRSTGCIVNASQGVIEVNRQRPSKVMHTSNPFGTPVVLCNAYDDRTEAGYIVKSVKDMLRDKKIASLSDVAVLYRTNAQSRVIEEACIQTSIPYRLVGGTRFYDRQEVKDVMSYVRLLVNPTDDIAVLRAINTPNRGIGAKTIDVLRETADRNQSSILNAMEIEFSEESSSGLRKNALKKLADFGFIIEKLKVSMNNLCEADDNEENKSSGTAAQLISEILTLTGYKDFLEKRTKSEDPSGAMNKFEERWRNIVELEAAAARHSTLQEFMESVSLMALSSDTAEEMKEKDAITLLTLHSGKGLEFNSVFIAGVEEGILPLIRNYEPDSSEEREAIEEERRLAFVGMTRAKKHLSMSYRSRVLQHSRHGAFWRDLKPSRFLSDIPKSLISQVRASSTTSNGRFRQSKSSFARKTPVEWNIGDSVRCSTNGRGTIVNRRSTANGTIVEVLFTDGTRKDVSPAGNLELLFSPSANSY